MPSELVHVVSRVFAAMMTQKYVQEIRLFFHKKRASWRRNYTNFFFKEDISGNIWWEVCTDIPSILYPTQHNVIEAEHHSDGYKI